MTGPSLSDHEAIALGQIKRLIALAKGLGFRRAYLYSEKLVSDPWKHRIGKRAMAFAHYHGHKLTPARDRTCEICGRPGSDGHHDDYTHPESVRWLCRKHHKQWHRNNSPTYPKRDLRPSECHPVRYMTLVSSVTRRP